MNEPTARRDAAAFRMKPGEGHPEERLPQYNRDAAVDRVCAELKPSAKKMVKEVLMLNDVPADLSWDGYLIVERWVDAAVRAEVEQAIDAREIEFFQFVMDNPPNVVTARVKATAERQRGAR